MGTGMCSRRQKGLLQTAFCLLTLACLAAGVFLYSHLQQKVRNAEALAQKYKQQQEALSAQLQVVYEHRSRLERSLQKERGEHKKTKEDFLVYKLEAQEALNKEKQDSMNRYGALSSQHKILKNQHEDVKKQLLELQLQHNSLRLEHRKSLESHSQKLSQLQQERDSQVTNLQDTVFKLREESKLLRKAHQEVHSQLLSAQVQMEEFRQLKEALQKMPGLRGGGGGGRGQQPLVPGSSQLQAGRQKDVRMMMHIQVRSHEGSQAPGLPLPEPGQTSPAGKAPEPGSQPPAGNSQLQMHSWKDLVSKVNAQMDQEQAQGHPKSPQFAPRGGQGGSPQPPSPRRGAERERMDEEELQMDAGVINREDKVHSQKEPVVQEPMMPDDAADPAQDPNNQGEDEFEEAELERPDFEEKVGGSEKFKEPRVKEEPKEKPPKEDPGGEVDDNDDLELVQERRERAGGKKDDYF